MLKYTVLGPVPLVINGYCDDNFTHLTTEAVLSWAPYERALYFESLWRPQYARSSGAHDSTASVVKLVISRRDNH